MKDSSASVPTPQPGKICAFFEHDSLHLGLVLECQNEACLLRLTDASTLRLSSRRFVLLTNAIYTLEPDIDTLAAFALEISATHASFTLQPLWDKLKLVDSSFSLNELLLEAGLPDTDAQLFALYLALREEPARFHGKNGLYRARTVAEYELYLAELVRRQQDDAYYTHVAAWLHSLATNTSPSAGVDPSLQRRLEEELRSAQPGHLPLRLHEICHAALPEYTPEQHWLLLRQALGQINATTDPILAHSNLPCLFSESLLHEADAVPPFRPEPDRLDLTDVPAWTIDADTTPDLDDALSLRQTADGWELGIHISEVAWFIKPGSALDLEARLRTSSLYLPGQIVHMLPQQISCDKASLLAGQVRPALSLLCSLSTGFELVNWQFRHTMMRVSRRFSYDGVDALLGSNSSGQIADQDDAAVLMTMLHSIAARHWQHRLAAGAQPPQAGEQTPARQLVAECMVIYNRCLAAYASRLQLPFLYRYLEDKLPDYDPNCPAITPPSVIGLLPLPHQAMGLAAYAQATSPLRRYADLINQRQMLAALKSIPLPYEAVELEALLPHLLQTRQAIRQITYRAEQRQCLLRLLSAGPGTGVEAIVRRAGHGHAAFYLPAWSCRIHTTLDCYLRPGQSVTLRICSLNPETAAAVVRIVEPEELT